MRRIVRVFVIESFALFVASRLAEGMVFHEGATTFLWTGVALTIATFFVRPIINLLLLPLNVITFGLFKWVGHALTLYLITLVIDNFEIVDFNFLGFATSLVSLPALDLGGGVPAFIGFSFIISIITSLVYWLVD